jgi:hypothetical protein
VALLRFCLLSVGIEMLVAQISCADFDTILRQERHSAILNEITDAISPIFVKYPISAQALLIQKVYPTGRTDKVRTKYIGAFEECPDLAFAISYADLTKFPGLFAAINFDPTKNYLLTNNISVFHCKTCDTYVVKDGNHRLLPCAFHSLDPILMVYEAASNDWRACRVDMKNFCE